MIADQDQLLVEAADVGVRHGLSTATRDSSTVRGMCRLPGTTPWSSEMWRSYFSRLRALRKATAPPTKPTTPIKMITGVVT